MSAFALVTGKLKRAPEARMSSKTGKTFATATVRDGEAWWSIVAFGEVADELLRLEAGDAIAVSGLFTAEVYVKDGAAPRISLHITADRIASSALSKRRRTRPELAERASEGGRLAYLRR